MNNFLGNLIDRHRLSSDSRESFKVQPRPISRFENRPLSNIYLDDNPRTHDSGTQDDAEFEASLPHPALNLMGGVNEKIKVTPKPLTETQYDLHRIEDIHTGEAQSRQVSSMLSLPSTGSDSTANRDERFVDIPVLLDRAQYIQKKPVLPNINQAFQQQKIIPDLTDHSSRLLPTNNFSSGGLNIRIQEILQRLKNQPSTEIQNKNELQLSEKSAIADLKNKEVIDPIQPLFFPETRSEESDRSTSKPTQADTPSIDIPVIQQSGLLQIPTWLTQMQTDLNNRWQALNNKVEVEPVVNVTIGRIEVRAIPSGLPVESKARNKPSGVMSLDDYLKQRQNRGQA